MNPNSPITATSAARCGTSLPLPQQQMRTPGWYTCCVTGAIVSDGCSQLLLACHSTEGCSDRAWRKCRHAGDGERTSQGVSCIVNKGENKIGGLEEGLSSKQQHTIPQGIPCSRPDVSDVAVAVAVCHVLDVCTVSCRARVLWRDGSIGFQSLAVGYVGLERRRAMGSCFGMGPVGCNIGLLSLLRSAQGAVISGITSPNKTLPLFPCPKLQHSSGSS